MPFIALQLVFDKGVTGHFLHTPHAMYAEMYTPQVRFGFHVDEAPAVVPGPRQKQVYDERFNRPNVQAHAKGNLIRTIASERLPQIARQAVPSPWLLMFVPVGLLGLRGPRWVLWAWLPLFVGLYVFWPFVLEHYCLIPAPAVILTIVLGARVVGGSGRAGILPVMTTLIVAGLAVISLPEFSGNRDDLSPTPQLRAIDSALANLQHKPAVVLFRFHDENNVHEEPVYNIQTARIDDASVIRAHDLGPRSLELFRYYAATQPNRAVYLYDRRSIDGSADRLTYLGTAQELASHGAETRP
jgi:hypothetical protein